MLYCTVYKLVRGKKMRLPKEDKEHMAGDVVTKVSLRDITKGWSPKIV